MSKIIGVVGSRRRNSDTDKSLVVEKFFSIYEEGDIICSGLCKTGADKFALDIHEKNFIPCLWFPANWPKYKLQAGFIRNTDIAKFSDILIACVAEDRTGGTEDTIKKFIEFHGKDNLIII